MLARTPIWQCRELVPQPLQPPTAGAQDRRIVQWRDGKFVCVIGPNCEASSLGIVFELQLARVEFGPVLLPQKRDQDGFLEVRPVRIPVDVEPTRVDGILTPVPKRRARLDCRTPRRPYG